MFLFLSKLLPLFIYPLGFACWLMVVAWVMVWKSPKRAATIIAIALAALLLASNGWVSDWLARSLEWQNIVEEKNLPTAEAIVVLGGGIKSAEAPRPWVDFSEGGDRIIYGSRLYLEKKAPLLVLSGGRISWQGDGKGASESKDMAGIAQFIGVPPSAILEDPSSLNTYENAVNVRQILEERGIKRVLLVTSAIHMSRSLLVFQHQGINVIPAPTDFLTTKSTFAKKKTSWQAIVLKLMPDAARLAKTTKALKEYLGIEIYRLRGWL